MSKMPAPAGALLVLCLLLCVPAWAGDDLPANWPWRGVVVSSSDLPAPAIAELRRDLGINSVSVHIKPRLRALRDKVAPDMALAREFAWADGILDDCRRENITALLVCSEFPMDPKPGFDQRSPRFWDDPALVEETVRAAGLLAEHFHARGEELAGYQILSEPVVFRDKRPSLPDAWPGTLERIIREFRRLDPQRWIAASLSLGADPDYRKARPLAHKRIIYNAHMYVPHLFTYQGIFQYTGRYTYPGRIQLRYWDRSAVADTLQPLAQFARANRVPVWIGEFSAVRWAEGAETYLQDVSGCFKENGFGWSYFSVCGFHGWNPDFNTEYSAHDDSATWRRQHVGRDSVRWRTLRRIFSTPAAGESPREAKP